MSETETERLPREQRGRQEYLDELEEYIETCQADITNMLDKLGWTPEHFMKARNLCVCPYSEGHQMPRSSLEKHEKVCQLVSQGCTKEEAERILDDTNYQYEGASCVYTVKLDKTVLNSVLWNHHLQNQSVFYGIEKMPLTPDEEEQMLSREDQLGLAEYIIKRAKEANRLKELGRDELLVSENLADLIKKDTEERKLDPVEEMAALRDYRRRRQTYRAKNVHITKKSHTEIMREVIANQMEMYAKSLTGEEGSVADEGSLTGDRTRDSWKQEEPNERRRDRDSHQRDRDRDPYHDRTRDSDRGRTGDSDRERTKYGERERIRDNDRERTRDRDRQIRDINRDKARDSDRESTKYGDRERTRDKETGRDREYGKENENGRDRDSERDRESGRESKNDRNRHSRRDRYVEEEYDRKGDKYRTYSRYESDRYSGERGWSKSHESQDRQDKDSTRSSSKVLDDSLKRESESREYKKESGACEKSAEKGEETDVMRGDEAIADNVDQKVIELEEGEVSGRGDVETRERSHSRSRSKQREKDKKKKKHKRSRSRSASSDRSSRKKHKKQKHKHRRKEEKGDSETGAG